jgi:hypothetical protein
MDAHAPVTHIPGYSRARLKRIIATGNIAAFAIGLWTIFFPTHFYTPALLLCILLPLWGLAIDMRTRGALGFEARRSLLTATGHSSRFADVRSGSEADMARNHDVRYSTKSRQRPHGIYEYTPWSERLTPRARAWPLANSRS